MEYQGFSCTCTKCGRTLYDGEMLNVKGKYICENCANSYIFGGSDIPPKSKRRMPSSFFHLICSCLPGAGHMYLGLMKKGLFQMCLFFLTIYLASSMPQLFGLIIPIVWMYSFFDSLSLKRKILNGEYVEDDLGSVSSFAHRYRGIVIIAVVAIIALNMFTSVSVVDNRRDSANQVKVVTQEVRNGPHREVATTTYYIDNNRGMMNLLMPAIIIGLGGLMLVKSSKRKKAEKDYTEGTNEWHYDDK